MSRVAPSLSYLTIYNPALRPTGPITGDEEDAEEQAHILFYTSKERAVSRDRMLRQIGLAKALVNFSEMFNADEACRNVHSQSRRMIMVSPEPDFWIHAGVDVSKTPRPTTEKGKNKERAKVQEKGKGKEKEVGNSQKERILYDYHDGSVHDLALQSDILRGYEIFKLTHGSFTSILTTLGQQALELQLERFFTVWAWSWNLEDGHEFSIHLGVPLHPLYRSLVPLLDTFVSQIPEGCVPVVLSPPHIIPSARFTDARYSSSLSRYLLSRISPPSPAPTIRNATDQVLHPSHDNEQPAPRPHDSSLSHLETSDLGATKINGTSDPATVSNTFLGMPGVNINMKDVRKWSWPGYLTFGKTQGKKHGTPSKHEEMQKEGTQMEEWSGAREYHSIEVDRVALEEAISTDNATNNDNQPSESPLESITAQPDEGTHHMGTAVPLNGESNPIPPPAQPLSGKDPLIGQPPQTDTPPSPGNQVGADSITPTHNELPSPHSIPSTPVGQSSIPSDPSLLEPVPEFSSISVYLADSCDILATHQHKVLYFTRHDATIALVGLDSDRHHETELDSIAEKGVGLLRDIRNVIDDEATKSLTESLPSATKILQPQDRHIISAGHLTLSSPGFESKSEHFYNAQQLYEKDRDISEVFSRGQNPQHWHVSRRGLGMDSDGVSVEGEIYMEISRKETSLADVDNVLAGTVRRFTE